MCLTLPLSGSLPASKTYARRSWTWVRNGDRYAMADGHLTITCRRSEKPGTRAEDDTYALQETKGEYRGPGARVFLLENLTDPESLTHETIVGHGFASCTCRGWVTTRGCKHVDAVRAMVDAGGMDAVVTEKVTTGPDDEPEAPAAVALTCRICRKPMGDVPGKVHPACTNPEAFPEPFPADADLETRRAWAIRCAAWEHGRWLRSRPPIPDDCPF